ncbi:hypothetical protein SAY87_016136 [Trapa incisa]|uniref:DUF7788 domain-containing protein n=1 Tax=Trapa incisa TaxID=236973 RepID=A0AAN7L7Z8_9MYRT|nr:hypothetical protein SAY87_016136 [Trapa incisa]
MAEKMMMGWSPSSSGRGWSKNYSRLGSSKTASPEVCTGIPLEVSVALGECQPWKGKVITFSESPNLHLIEGDDLSKVQSLEDMDCGMNTDFQKVLDQILEVAQKGKLSSDLIVNLVFVFSDMEFDEASTDRPWETDYEVIKRKFREAGYGRLCSGTEGTLARLPWPNLPLWRLSLL